MLWATIKSSVSAGAKNLYFPFNVDESTVPPQSARPRSLVSRRHHAPQFRTIRCHTKFRRADEKSHTRDESQPPTVHRTHTLRPLWTMPQCFDNPCERFPPGPRLLNFSFRDARLVVVSDAFSMLARSARCLINVHAGRRYGYTVRGRRARRNRFAPSEVGFEYSCAKTQVGFIQR